MVRLLYGKNPLALMFSVSRMERQHLFIPIIKPHISFHLQDADILEAKKENPLHLRLSSPLFDQLLRPMLKMTMQTPIFEMLEACWQIPP